VWLSRTEVSLSVGRQQPCARMGCWLRPVQPVLSPFRV